MSSSNNNDNSISSVAGFRIKKYTSIESRGDNGSGTLQVILEAPIDDVRCLGHEVDDVVAAFTMHQIAKEPIVLTIRFPEED